MHVSPLSYKIGACQIFVKNVSTKNKQIFAFGLLQPGPFRGIIMDEHDGKTYHYHDYVGEL